jgi:hypothetical protein
MDIYAVRQGLANAASSVVLRSGGLTLTCLPYTPDSVPEPCFFIADYEIDFDKSMNRSQDKVTFTCRALVGHADDQSAQKLVDQMFSGSGDASLKQALESGRGGPGEGAFPGTDYEDACDDFRVTRTQGNRWYDHAGSKYVGGEIIIEVIGSGV